MSAEIALMEREVKVESGSGDVVWKAGLELDKGLPRVQIGQHHATGWLVEEDRDKAQVGAG